MKADPCADWEESYLTFAAENQHLWPLIKGGLDMAPVARVDIYRFFSKFREGKYLTPAERVEIDKLLDELGAKR